MVLIVLTKAAFITTNHTEKTISKSCNRTKHQRYYSNRSKLETLRSGRWTNIEFQLNGKVCLNKAVEHTLKIKIVTIALLFSEKLNEISTIGSNYVHELRSYSRQHE
jgi:hypothetical protein